MPTLLRSKRFEIAVTRLPKEVLKKLGKTLRLLADDPRHSSLQTKKMEGHVGLFEARVDQKYRLTYERLPGDVLKLRAVGRHDEALRNPSL